MSKIDVVSREKCTADVVQMNEKEWSVQAALAFPNFRLNDSAKFISSNILSKAQQDIRHLKKRKIRLSERLTRVCVEHVRFLYVLLSSL